VENKISGAKHIKKSGEKPCPHFRGPRMSIESRKGKPAPKAGQKKTMERIM